MRRALKEAAMLGVPFSSLVGGAGSTPSNLRTKFLDTAGTVSFVAPSDAAGGEMDPTSGCTGCLSSPAVGTGEQQRVGRKILLKSLQIKGNISGASLGDQADVLPAPECFLAVVLDKQTNAAQLNSEDVYKNTLANATLAHLPLRDLEQSSRFKVLKEKRWSLLLDAVGTDGTSTNTATFKRVSFDWFIQFKRPIRVVFNAVADTADVAQVVDNSIHLVGFANTTNYTPTLRYNCRVKFEDQ